MSIALVLLSPLAIHAAEPAMLDGEHHALSIETTVAPGNAAEGARQWIAVGASVPISVPDQLGTGHGPFYLVYPRDASVALHATGGLSVAGSLVRCERAGVFELAVTVTPKTGAPIRDSIHLGCAVPTRFTAEASSEPLVAGYGATYASFRWFGRTPAGDEIELAGSLPVTVPSREHAITLEKNSYGSIMVRPLRAAHAPIVASAGLEAPLPLEIVDEPWTLELSLVERGRSDSDRVWVSAHMVGEDHRALGGLEHCTVTSYDGAVATKRGDRCSLPVTRAHVKPRRDIDFNADRVCVASGDHKACIAIP